MFEIDPCYTELRGRFRCSRRAIRMRKGHLAVVTVSVFVAIRTLDLLITFHFSPSLTREGNPVFLATGGGAATLLAITSAFSILVIGGVIAFWSGRSFVWDHDPAGFRPFVGAWLRRVALTRQSLKSYFPKNTHSIEGLQAVRLFGLALSWALIFGSAAACYAWLAIFAFESPRFLKVFSFLALGRFSLFPSLTAIPGFVFGAWLFFWSEFARIKTRKPIQATCNIRRRTF
jgi:hypothetical protein